MSLSSNPQAPQGRREYRYLADNEYFNPIVDVQKRSSKDTREILQDRSNFRPRKGQSWRSIRRLLDQQGSDTKVILVARHGHSEHNKFQEKHGLDCFNATSNINQAFYDPGLTDEGHRQARKLGELLSAVLLDESGVRPRDVGFYSSSLNRCIHTAAIAANAVFQGDAERCRTEETSHVREQPAVIVFDEFREWLGWDHNAGSDRRSSKTDIKHAFRESNVDLMFRRDFPEEDVMCQAKVIQEHWVDVRRRWERALDWIYENDERKYICLFSNNRSLQCGLDVLGLPLDADLVQKHKKITVVNMANGAMLAFVVHRQPLSGPEGQEKEREWTRVKQEEYDIILALKAKEAAARQNPIFGKP